MNKSSKKRVLIIASHYPPDRRVGGVIRIAKLVKYLPINGWDPIVVTTPIDRSFPSDELFKQVANLAKVHRLPRLDMRVLFHGIYRVLNKIRLALTSNKKEVKLDRSAASSLRPPLASLYLVPDPLVLWAVLATVRAVLLVAFKRIDVIYATSPMQSGLIVGYLIKRICRKPLIIEMRDPWTTNPFAVKRAFRILDCIEDALERRILIAADRIVVINENFIPSMLEKYPSLNEEKFSVIPNGFDEDDFKDLDPVRGEALTIVHAGQFYQGRTPLPFLKALSVASSRYSSVRDKWRLRLVGSGDEYRGVIEELGIASQVDFVGIVPHKLALRNIAGADLLLLVPGDGLSTMTGKIFEYVAAKRPIFVVANDCAAANLITRFGIGCVAPPGEIDTIAARLVDLMEIIESGAFRYPDLQEVYDNYERKGIAARCSAVMDAVVNDATSRQRVVR